MTNKAYLSKRTTDSLIQVWLDRRYISTATRWMEENGIAPRFMSDVFKFMFESVVDNLVEDNQVNFVESTIDATEHLNDRFRNNLNPQGKGLKNLSKNLRIEQQDSFSFKKTERDLEGTKEEIEKEMKKFIPKYQVEESDDVT